jgi:hypothetical protein
MKPKEIQDAVKQRLLRNADYLESLAEQYNGAIKGRPTTMHKQKIAKMRTLAILSREIAYELTR